jgi:hypothetical protein
MKLEYKIVKHAILFFAVSLAINGCQKMHRPELTELLLDPPPPAYTDLKSFWAFENNVTDQGENKLSATATNVTYVPGVTGQAAKIGPGGYILLKADKDTVTYPNGFKGIPGDTLKNLGSFTLAFWMNGVGPVKDGAQGLFSISNKNEFWGNLDLFLENLDNGSEAFLKVHMFNAGVVSGNGEEWNEVKIPNALNKWTHIAITYDATGSKFTIYADGQPTAIKDKVLGGGNYGAVKYNNFNGMVLGTYQFQTTPTLTNHGPEGWAKSFNGALDQFRLYDRSLSAAEITDLYTTKK